MGAAGFGFGVPELIIILIVFVTSAIPLIAAIWMLVTLYRMRVDQQAMRRSLESIEHLLRAR